MSGFGGFGGFGQSNNQNTGGGFGGFGQSNNNTSGGFGSNTNTNTGFGGGGGGSLFGNNNTSNTGGGFGGFGGSGGGFGQNKTGFGSAATTSGGGLFGGSGTATAGTGFGGFGNNNTSGGFGSSNTGTGLFGQQNKPATGGFGSGGSLFGGGNTTGGGFGASNNNTTTNTGFGGFGGGAAASTQNNGTGSVPFSEVTEKDAASTGNMTNKFQSITTQDAYKNFSFEELRSVDYQQNRKQGSANGGAGSFGAGSAFGGFGANTNNNTTTNTGFGASNAGGGLFGSNNTTNTTGGFGSGNTGGGLFGSKPATGGLFGSSTTTSAPSGGGLFGTSNTGGGFGSGFGNNNASSGTTTGGLFGTANNQAKPAFGGFGASTNTGGGFGASTGGGFGSNTQTSNTSGGLFGNNNTTNTGFGNTQQPASSGFSFGAQNNQNNQQPAQSGGLFGSGGFGQNNQQKPGGLFGSSTTPATGGGLFGNTNNQTQQSGGLFGNNNTQNNQSGGLFGNKPATGGLFGNTNTGNTGGGLFGSTNQQPAQSGGLFGSTNNQQSGGLFGNKPATGGGLFGNTQQNNQPQQTNSLFGNTQQNAQPAGNSLFGGSLLSAPPQQQTGSLNASLLQNPYGNDALFANIGSPSQSVGPLATPLAASQKNKKQTIIPAYKLSPAASSRLTTPQKRPGAGYGFSYSTYGTPGSAIPGGSPFGFSNTMSPAYGRSLNKSMSTSNLRNSFSAEESILNPAAFSSTVRGGTGRLKKLNVDRSLNSSQRKPLFAPATPEPRKSVSFDTSVGPRDTNGSSGLDSTNGALVRTESPTSSPNETNGASSRGKELAVVPEDRSPDAAPAVKAPAFQAPRSHADQAPGGYWSKPSIEEIRNMPRDQAQNYTDFKVGCKGSGEITFHKVDLTSFPLEKLFGDIVDFETRKVSVYGPKTTITKPARGQGLNVPSTITLANSWPRSNAGATEVLEKKGIRFDKHVNRLKRIPETEFISYNANSGEWTFKVQHYTTYGLPDDDEDESMLDDSILSPNPASPTPLKVSKLREQLSSPNGHSDASLPSPPDSSPDDTFDFKKGKRKHLPGQFDDEQMDDEMYEEEEEVTGTLSFLGQRSVGSSVADAEDAIELGMVEDLEMAGSFPLPTRTTEQPTAIAPKSILKNSIMNGGTPLKTGPVFFGDDWTEQLQRTVSPKKQDRAALRASQSVAFKSPEHEPTPKAADRKQPFATSMDLMNSLFNQSTRSNASPAKFGGSTSGTEYPSKRAKTRGNDESKELDDAFHQSSKPQWGPDGTLVYLAGPMAARLGRNGVVEKFAASIVGERNDVRFAKLAGTGQATLPATLTEQQNCTDITYEKGSDIPHATTSPEFEFIQFFEKTTSDELSDRMEQRAWELAHILFDAPRDAPDAVAASERDRYQLRSLKDKVSEFWKKIVRKDVQEHVARAESEEEKAFAYLTGGLIEEACNALVEAKNFHLATLVAQIGCDRKFRQAMSNQLDNWRALNCLAEFEDSIRAIYELLAGNTCICRGQAAAGGENVTSTFTFATRFNLDWRRSFGLRLWYGIDPDQGVEEAVMHYLQDLSDGSEEVKPVPWFIEQEVETGWKDEAASTREDLLWSLLQLHGGDSFDLAAAFAPEAVTGNPMDARLSFQLITLFQARGVGVAADLEADTIDSLATTYAAGLAATITEQLQALISAVWVLLHVSDSNARQQAIRALLDQHAGLIDPPEGKIFTGLRDLRIPDNWTYLSKALYARAVLQDPVAEAQNLLEAGEWNQAHEVVCRTVGPLAVIENDADSLRELLGGLHEPVRKGTRYADAWDRGAGIYYDFVEMRDLEAQKGQRWKELVSRVTRALQRVHNEGGFEHKELRERAALQIMGDETAECVKDLVVKEKARVSEVPRIEDAYLAQARRLREEYFQALVAAS